MDTGSFLWGVFTGAGVAWGIVLTMLLRLSYKAAKEHAGTARANIPEQRKATRDDVR